VLIQPHVFFFFITTTQNTLPWGGWKQGIELYSGTLAVARAVLVAASFTKANG
jgi:hypothetical protein